MKVSRIRVAKVENGQSVALEVERVHLGWAPQAAELEGGGVHWFLSRTVDVLFLGHVRGGC